MKWKKLKHLFAPDKNYPWMWSHAANPVPWVLNRNEQIVRIFFTCRTAENISHIAFADFDFANDFQLLQTCVDPVLRPGQAGLFDDSGTAMGCIVEKDRKFFLYYLGWNLKVTVPWLNTIGLAVADSIDRPFTKFSDAPLMDRSHEDPFSISYPSVLFDDGIYKMWYGSNLAWGKQQHEMQHVIKYAESTDLIHWKRTNKVHVALEHPNEYALSKPWVIKKDGRYFMWYSYRGNGSIETYRIGFAESADGKTWIRKDDQAGIDVSETGWDSEMICYPSVFSLGNKTYMLYNGNGYGRTGFGIAVLE